MILAEQNTEPTQLNWKTSAMVSTHQSYHPVPLPAHHHLSPEKAQAEAESFLENNVETAFYKRFFWCWCKHYKNGNQNSCTCPVWRKSETLAFRVDKKCRNKTKDTRRIRSRRTGLLKSRRRWWVAKGTEANWDKSWQAAYHNSPMVYYCLCLALWSVQWWRKISTLLCSGKWGYRVWISHYSSA